MSDDLTGRLVASRFRLTSKLGVGGMGEVYVAEDQQDGPTKGQSLAVKVIRESLSESPEAIARFEREVQAVSALNHPNIVRFISAGQDGGLRFLAMELLTGTTLKSYVATKGAIPWRATLPVLRGIVRALQAAHANGLIHRDLKPENVFLTVVGGVAGNGEATDAIVKLLDFGVAKHTALPEGQTMTGTGIIVGTPGFVAPEVVLHGTSDDPRSDFYGLGATWFEMLTGSKPFTAATPFALAMRHLNEKPPRPTDLLPFSPVPVPVEDLLFALLEKAPENRPKDAAELLARIDALETASTGTPLPSQTELTHLQRTLTDMQTPRPEMLGRSSAARLGLDPAQPHTTPETTSTRVRDFDDVEISRTRKAYVSRRRRRAAMVAVVALVALVAFARGARQGKHRRHEEVDAGFAIAPPLPQVVDAGQPVARILDIVDTGQPVAPALDAGAAAVDAGVRHKKRPKGNDDGHAPVIDFGKPGK